MRIRFMPCLDAQLLVRAFKPRVRRLDLPSGFRFSVSHPLRLDAVVHHSEAHTQVCWICAWSCLLSLSSPLTLLSRQKCAAPRSRAADNRTICTPTVWYGLQSPSVGFTKLSPIAKIQKPVVGINPRGFRAQYLVLRWQRCYVA
jgi:hypothetical protein